jgi:uncharacterized protein (TIGR00297 family)
MLVVLPAVGTNVVLEARGLMLANLPFLLWTIWLSALLGLVAWKTGSATPAAALAGAGITASLMCSSAGDGSSPWRTGLLPVVALLVLTSLATRVGRANKERMGLAEGKLGRGAAQVAANLGSAALAACPFVQMGLVNERWFATAGGAAGLVLAPALAALAEAAADTVSSEIGQVFGGRPWLITTLRRVDAGTDGAMSAAGIVAGSVAAAMVAGVGAWALSGGWRMVWIAGAAGVFGMFFDSLLGAAVERRGWLNNDLVNFLSTASAAVFAVVLAAMAHAGAR